MSKEEEQNKVVKDFALYRIVYQKICEKLGFSMELADEAAFQDLSDKYGAKYLNELFNP